MNETTRFLSDQDYENGFKDVEILYRSGRRDTIRLTAPSYREAQQLTIELSTSKNPFCVTRAALPKEHRDEKFLDKLTPDSAASVENTAFALTFGEDVLGKLESQAAAILTNLMSTPGEEQKLPSSELATVSTT